MCLLSACAAAGGAGHAYGNGTTSGYGGGAAGGFGGPPAANGYATGVAPPAAGGYGGPPAAGGYGGSLAYGSGVSGPQQPGAPENPYLTCAEYMSWTHFLILPLMILETSASIPAAVLG